MEQIPPSRLPAPETGLPAPPAVIPRLPTRLQPGRHAPLPDAVAVRKCAVPATAPPFDDEATISGNAPVTATAEEPWDGNEAALTGGAGEAAVSPGVLPDHGEPDKGLPGPPPGWASQFAQILAEALAGARPARQLTPWTTEQARRRIRQLGPMLATDQRPKVRRVMTSAPAAGVLEMTAVVGFGPRTRVLALRLELEQPRKYRQASSHWCCTAIESA